jgi:hypothetical protein
MVGEIGLDGFLVRHQSTLGTIKPPFFAARHAARAILVAIVGHGAGTDLQEGGDLRAGEPLTSQIEGFHFLLYARMRMMKAFIV